MYRLCLVAMTILAPATMAADWPAFRGPTGDGQYVGKPLPIEWGTKNQMWSVDIPGHGWSSPVVVKNRVYLTSAIGDKEPKSDQQLVAICLDAETGKTIWQKTVFEQAGAKAPKPHGKNSHASPTPIVDGERLYVHFGHMGTAALGLDKGDILWEKKYTYAPVHGNGGSPALVDNHLIFSCDGSDQQFVVALDKRTGKEVWKTAREANPTKGFSFGTPTVFESGKIKQVISPGSNIIAGYDPISGKEIWRISYQGYSLIPKPIIGHDMVYFSTGYDSASFHGAKFDGTGDLTSKIAISLKKNAPHTPSPLLIGDEVYMISDNGFLTCFDAKSGEVHYSERLPNGGYSASPIAADGKIYTTSETGKGAVIKAGKKFELLKETDMNEKTFASFAAVDGSLYIRTETKLVRYRAKQS